MNKNYKKTQTTIYLAAALAMSSYSLSVSAQSLSSSSNSASSNANVNASINASAQEQVRDYRRNISEKTTKDSAQNTAKNTGFANTPAGVVKITLPNTLPNVSAYKTGVLKSTSSRHEGQSTGTKNRNTRGECDSTCDLNNLNADTDSDTISTLSLERPVATTEYRDFACSESGYPANYTGTVSGQRVVYIYKGEVYQIGEWSITNVSCNAPYTAYTPQEPTSYSDPGPTPQSIQLSYVSNNEPSWVPPPETDLGPAPQVGPTPDPLPTPDPQPTSVAATYFVSYSYGGAEGSGTATIVDSSTGQIAATYNGDTSMNNDLAAGALQTPSPWWTDYTGSGA